MSYDIQLFRKETKEKQLAGGDADFFEDESNLIPFTAEQKQELKDRLLAYDFVIEREENGNIHYGNEEDESVSAMLTNSGIYFSTTGDVFDLSMTTSEFTDSGEFSKFDPQAGGWEEEF